MQVLVAGLVMLALAGSTLRALLVGNQNLAIAGTVFAGIFVQAIPFLALGVLVSGLVAAFVSADRVGRGGVDGCAAPAVPAASRRARPGGIATGGADACGHRHGKHAGRSVDHRQGVHAEGRRTHDLARVVIICCAADARLASIHLGGPEAVAATTFPDETLGQRRRDGSSRARRKLRRVGPDTERVADLVC